jgi:hypothetical protein
MKPGAPDSEKAYRFARRTLFDIGADLVAWNDLVEEVGGEVTDPTVDAALTAWFESIHGEESSKLDGYVNLIRELDAQANAADIEAAYYRKIAQYRSNRVLYLKRRLREYLEATGQKKVVTDTGRTVAVQANGGTLPIRWADGIVPSELPERFRRIRVETDAEAVRSALDSGEELPFAAFGDRGSQLRIR